MSASANHMHQSQAWDHVAGVVCVTEAGGRVSDLHGKHLPLGNGSIDFVPGKEHTSGARTCMYLLMFSSIVYGGKG